MRILGILMLVLVFGSVVRAADSVPIERVKASLLADTSKVQAGQNFRVGVLLTMSPHWHVYWKNPGDAGMPTTVRVKAPEGFEVGPVQYPIPKKFNQPGDIVGYGYEESVMLMVPVKAAKNLASGTKIPITAEVAWLCCKDVCMPGKADLNLTLMTGQNPSPANQNLFAHWTGLIPMEQLTWTNIKIEGNIPPKSSDGAFKITVQWNRLPREVQWYPEAGEALSVTNVTIQNIGGQTQITFKVHVMANAAAPVKMGSVLSYTDEAGQRHGIQVAIPLR